MKCTDLAGRIERLCPGAGARDVARLCLLLANTSQNVEEFRDDGTLVGAWKEMDFRFRSATQEHVAVAEELDTLQSWEGRQLTHTQIWTLIAAIRAQSQMLQFYMGAGSTPGA